MSGYKKFILSLDQGTTSTRAILFDAGGRPVRSHALPLRQIYPANGWVEHDPREIWQAALACARAVLQRHGRRRCRGHRHHQPARDFSGLGPEDRRAAAQCHRLAGPARRGALRRSQEARLEADITRKTGLLLDPYFSATKLEWLLKNVERLKSVGASRAPL